MRTSPLTILLSVFPTIPPPPNRLLVFARLPELGKVKTRLARRIGEEQALAVYEAMLRDVLGGIGTSTATTDIEICWAPTPAASGEALARAFGEHTLAMQTGPTLGDRLSMAFSERFFFHRTRKIIAIGVDEPRIDRARIDHAFALLDSCEWVVGPAEDGGYYLIGCRAAAFDSDLFRDVEWGTSEVLPETLRRIREGQSTFALLPTRYDIDTIEDLERYAAEGHRGELGSLAAAFKNG
jgi:rSAM/selenodomain-associated transferase 1